MALEDLAFDSAAAVFAFDESLRIRTWNRGAEVLTGVSERDAVGRRCWEALRGCDASGRVVCHRRCSAARLARAGRLVPTRTLIIPGETPRTVSVETIVIRDSGELRLLHVLRPEREAEAVTPADDGPRRISPPVRGGLAALRASAGPAPRTLDDVLAQLAPDRLWSELLDWPPDVFAVTSAALSDSGAYRLVVSPKTRSWPPPCASGAVWRDEVRTLGRAWAAEVTAEGEEGLSAVQRDLLLTAAARLESSSDVSLADLQDTRQWDVLVELLTLHAAADEASAGILRADSPHPAFRARAARLLTTTGSLSRLAPDRCRVLPKLRLPATGLTARSLSRHLHLDRSEVESRWHVRPPCRVGSAERALTLLLVPHPSRIEPMDVRAVQGPLAGMDRSRSGFFEFEPHEPFDPAEVARLVQAACDRTGDLDIVLLPEAAVDADELALLRSRLSDERVHYLVAGVRQPASGPRKLGANYAFVGTARVDGWSAAPQHKHHRWCLEGDQIAQYDFDLDPGRRWWEAISVHRRTLTFVTIADWLTICPLVCEDLARPEPVADVLRGVAPTLIVALLLDGPQLAVRWPARYASVLAEDPGSSVLTLTALGMAERSHPPGMPRSRVVALWKDPQLGVRELTLDDGARAILLTTNAIESPGIAIDGRQDDFPATQLRFASAEQIG